MPVRSIRNLEIHAAHALQPAVRELHPLLRPRAHRNRLLEDADAWMAAWDHRLAPQVFSVLGGEPTVHPRLAEFLRLSRRHWPTAHLRLVTNGFFLHRHPDLPLVLADDPDAAVYLSVHHDGPDYRAKVQPALDLLAEWVNRYDVRAHVYDSVRLWKRTVKGVRRHARAVRRRESAGELGTVRLAVLPATARRSGVEVPATGVPAHASGEVRAVRGVGDPVPDVPPPTPGLLGRRSRPVLQPRSRASVRACARRTQNGLPSRIGYPARPSESGRAQNGMTGCFSTVCCTVSTPSADVRPGIQSDVQSASPTNTVRSGRRRLRPHPGRVPRHRPNDTPGLTPSSGTGTAGDPFLISSLRSAVQQANTSGADDAIILPAGIYTLTNLGANEDAALTGDLDVADVAVEGKLMVAGAGAGITIIDGNKAAGAALADRIFQVGAGDLTLNNLTIRNAGSSAYGAIQISSIGTIALNGATVTGQPSAESTPSAAPTLPSRTASSPTIGSPPTRRVALGFGVFGAGSTLTIRNSQFTGNATAYLGGAIA